MHLRRTTARTGLALIVAAAGLGLLPDAAGADPVNAKKGQLIPLVCDELGSVTVAVNGNGAFTPGLVVTSTQVGVPYEIHASGTFTPHDPNFPTETFTDDNVKPAPRNRRLDVCTFHVEWSDDYGTVVFDGVAKISYTPIKG